MAKLELEGLRIEEEGLNAFEEKADEDVVFWYNNTIIKLSIFILYFKIVKHLLLNNHYEEIDRDNRLLGNVDF